MSAELVFFSVLLALRCSEMIVMGRCLSLGRSLSKGRCGEAVYYVISASILANLGVSGIEGRSGSVAPSNHDRTTVTIWE